MGGSEHARLRVIIHIVGWLVLDVLDTRESILILLFEGLLHLNHKTCGGEDEDTGKDGIALGGMAATTRHENEGVEVVMRQTESEAIDAKAHHVGSRDGSGANNDVLLQLAGEENTDKSWCVCLVGSRDQDVELVEHNGVEAHVGGEATRSTDEEDTEAFGLDSEVCEQDGSKETNTTGADGRASATTGEAEGHG